MAWPFKVELDSGSPIASIPAGLITGMAEYLNKIRGGDGITIEYSEGGPVIRMGDDTFILRTFWSAAPTFTDGELAGITFQQLAGFVQTVGTGTEVEANPCECSTP